MSLRSEIIHAMREYETKARKEWGDRFHPKYAEYCTWWFSGRIGRPTSRVRAELKRMEKDGLVTCDRSRSNNHRWLLVAAGNAEVKPS